ncbi:ABC transporter ATP-binding protein [Levilactobacillus bambusae]|uniref:ABC transporter n=1 Tax=Levilactobacillus bambusae TaxID=2024736 RepID=A0A2V1MY20_9LACO|nr:ABC transporter ATP-binding protein [Levilactobacillus bambusae]PWF99886.1 ABC transporter [Levilactobacillus bambusae]
MLETKDLAYWYENGSRPLFKDVNLTFEAGKSYAIVGQSGTGKTTFLSLLAGLDHPKAGEILYDNETLKKIGLTNYRRRDVSIVFQAYNLFNYMSPVNNLMTAMAITNAEHRGDQEYAKRMLEQIGIPKGDFNRNVTHLSGGQQQRVAIARTMCCDAALVVADEPTGNLDEQNTKAVINQFQSIAHDQGKCVIIVTHEPEVAKQCDVEIQLADREFQTVVR